MKNISQKILWTSFLFACVLGLTWQFFPVEDAKSRLSSLPLTGAEFEGYNIPLSDGEKGFFKDVNVIKRIYEVQNKSYFITVLDGTKNRHAVHDPFYCFTGDGWKLKKRENIPSPKGHVGLLTLEKGSRTKEALVFFSTPKYSHSSAFTFFLQTTFRRFTLGKSSDEPILIVIQAEEGGKTDWVMFIKSMPSLFKL
jgi:hypothetical protein